MLPAVGLECVPVNDPCDLFSRGLEASLITQEYYQKLGAPVNCGYQDKNNNFVVWLAWFDRPSIAARRLSSPQAG